MQLQGDCVICLKPKKESLQILQCSHVFHISCIQEWFEKNRNCPLGRSDNSNEPDIIREISILDSIPVMVDVMLLFLFAIVVFGTIAT